MSDLLSEEGVVGRQDLFDALRCGQSLLERMPPTDQPVDERATLRLQRWKAQPAFADESVWASRLRADGLTETDLLALLADERPGPERLDNAVLPDWLMQSDVLLGPDEVHDDASAQYPFLLLAQPYLAPAVQRLRTFLGTLAVGLADTEKLIAEALRPLATQANDMLTRACILDLHLMRTTGSLRGATSADRFTDFVATLGTAAYRASFYSRYPVLARQLHTAVANWTQSVELLFGHLDADRNLLAGVFGLEAGRLAVGTVALGMGDRHRGGQSVTRIDFTSGQSVMYKPRPLKIDICYRGLMGWLNQRGLRYPLAAAWTVDRGSYGWQEVISYRRCESPSELERFYFRQGALLAILYVLSANDFHSENIIAHADQPFVIDLESIAQPSLELRDERLIDVEESVAELTSRSVLRVGLLPSRGWEQVGRPGADISGIGGRSGQESSLKFPFILGAGTDEMSVELRTGQTADTLNQPSAGLGPAELIAFTDELSLGFTDAYLLMMRHRDGLVADTGPLSAFADAECRVLARHTVHYGVVHVASFHPDVLRDGLDRERHYDHLWADAKNVPTLAAFIAAERADLWNNDIPVFTSPLARPVVLTSAGDELAGLVRTTGMDAVLDRVRSLSEADLDRQTWLIRASMAAAATDLAPSLTYPSFECEPDDPTIRYSGDELIVRADQLGYRLAALAFRHDGGAEWLGVNSSRGQSWSLGALGPDLYHGLSGVALFLAALFAATRDGTHRSLAIDALATANLQVERRMLDGLGGTSGLSGFIYGTELAATLIEEPDLARTALALIPRTHTGMTADTEHDLSAGAAGTILQLRSLARDGHDAALQMVAAAADVLVKSQDDSGGWLAESMVQAGLAVQPLTGLAHGAAGIVWSLQEAAVVLGTDEFEDSIVRGLAYEQRLYLPEFGNWRDVRDADILTGGRPDELGRPLSAWCHGAAGIALARARVALHRPSSAELATDIVNAVETTLREGFGQNHSLCHGDLGNADIVGLVASQLGRGDWTARSESALHRAVYVGENQGWLCGMPRGVETPGLMTGLAGIGYALLRAAQPHALPSVLAYDPLG